MIDEAGAAQQILPPNKRKKTITKTEVEEIVAKIARKVTVLHEGSVIAEGAMDQVQNDPRVIEVYLGR